MKPKRAWTASLFVALVLLAGFSTSLSLTRIYQVDECQAVYMARVFATGQSAEFFTTSSLFLFGPLSWLTKSRLDSAEMFTAARLVFLAVFWANLLLLASIVAGRLSSIRGLFALVTAATLAPLWDYGFEIRHDNLILTGMLLLWWAVRVKPMGLGSYTIAGVVTASLLFLAVKTVVYVLPLSFAVLVFPPPALKRPRWQLGLAWLSGALMATAVVRVAYGSTGAWDTYLSVFRGLTGTTGEVVRFWPWETLGRLLQQTPLLLALTFAACLVIAVNLARRRKAALTWEGNLPEAMLLLGVLAGLLANPTPFPYNLIHVVPYAFMLAFKYGDTLWQEFRNRTLLWPLVGAVLIFVHVAPFLLATQRHWKMTNLRQEQLMHLSEAMTDPVTDPVYDAIGMVPTRRSVHFQWYLHSLSLRGMLETPGMRLREMLAARPAAVFIPSYRTDWLGAEDHEFIKRRYVPLADDFWVLGAVLPPSGGDFEIVHPGRYFIDTLSRSGIMRTDAPRQSEVVTGVGAEMKSATLDGKPISSGPVELPLGTHRLEVPSHLELAVVWLGPKLEKHQPLARGDHRYLFINWY